VQFSLETDASPTEDERALVQTVVADVAGVPEVAVRAFSLYSSQTTFRHQRRRLTPEYRWDMNFNLVLSLESTGYATVDEFRVAVIDALAKGVADAVSKALPTIEVLSSSEDVVVYGYEVTREPTLEPVPMPTVSLKPTTQERPTPMPLTPTPTLQGRNTATSTTASAASASVPMGSTLFIALGLMVIALTPAAALASYRRAAPKKPPPANQLAGVASVESATPFSGDENESRESIDLGSLKGPIDAARFSSLELDLELDLDVDTRL